MFGWTKLYQNNSIKKTTWTFLFRLTINEPDHLHDVSKIGDRTLAVWIHSSLKFVWIGYDFNFPENADINRNGYKLNPPAFTID